MYLKNKEEVFRELMETMMKKMYEVGGVGLKSGTKEEGLGEIVKERGVLME
ncbi:hypothetical protein [Siminovitchia fortis]|uniref:hypothetical protein n=1 Tax=Siminovitchia fortis TaxID=254758 RepID=UPI0016435E8E|nr:hypothetical protein [Siminovitchia fortis]